MVALAGLVLAVTFFFGITELWHIYVILWVRAFCTAFQMPAMESSISLIVPQDKLVNVAGYNQILFWASNIVWPALWAVALATLPMYWVLAIDVIWVIIASITLFLVQIPRPPKVEAESEEKHVFREMHFWLKTLMQNKWLYHLTLIMAFMCFIFMPVASLFPLMTLEHFGWGATQASIVEVAFGVWMILGSALLSVLGWVKKKINLIMTWVISMWVFTMAMGALPSEGYRFFVLFSALMWAGMPLFNGPYMALIQSTIEPGVQWRVMSFSFSAMTIASPLGLIASWVFADQIGVPMWFFISGIIMTAWSVVAYFLPSLHKIE